MSKKPSNKKSKFSLGGGGFTDILQRLHNSNPYLLEGIIALVCMALLLYPMLAARSRSSSASPESPTPSANQTQTVQQPAEDITVSVYMADQETSQEMDFEEYLVGVVAAEVPASYEAQALKAQAVAARTYAYQKMNAGGCKSGFDVCTDFGCCQAYNTEQQRRDKWEGEFDKYEGIIKEAVYSTTGEIMVYENEPIQAFFHSTSGGMTEDCENVYGNTLPYLISVLSEGEEDAPRYRRTITMDVDEFIAGIKRIAPETVIDKNDTAASIGEIVRYDSGRVNTINIGGVEIGGRTIRSAFTLDSTNFTIGISGNNVSITTQGYGHGVGMSQAGANAMAKNGSEYKDILLHYYTGIEFLQISEVGANQGSTD